MNENILATENLTKDFDGFKAINNLNFSMAPGELRVVIGPNGAGKTTFLDLIDRKSTRLNSSHVSQSRMPSSA